MRELRTDALLSALAEAGFEFVVVGGVAAIAYGATRSTKDLDVVAPMTPENLARLLTALGPHHPMHLLRPDLGVVRQTAAELSAYRILLLTTDLGRLDVLSRVEPVGTYADIETNDIELIEGRRFRVIALDQLLASKRYAGRPHDLEVECELRRIAMMGKAADPEPDL